ncbi:MAG: dihydrodipicolinate synthase family protein [Vicinamibacterales bacterium]
MTMTLGGVLAPIPTPIDATDRVRPDMLRAAFARWLPTPLSGFVILGSNGEAALLDDAESDAVIAAARACVPRDRMLIAGTGRESTLATVAASRRAAELGADMVLVRTPGFFKTQMTAEVFVRHYTAVADECPVPVLLYNFTAVTGVNLPVAAVQSLSQHPNIVGIKESGSDVAQVGDFFSATTSDFAVLAGSSSTFYAALCVGASGGILALANVVPDACVRVYDLVKQKNHVQAREAQRQLIPLGRLLGTTLGVAGLKAALQMTGCDVGVPRPPLTPVAAGGLEALKAALSTFEEVRV